MFQENLKTLRKNKGITQEELAARLNIPQNGTTDITEWTEIIEK